MSSRKRPRLKSPANITPIEISPISDDEEATRTDTTNIPIIQIEDISDSETESEPRAQCKRSKMTNQVTSLHSPMKMLSHAKIMETMSLGLPVWAESSSSSAPLAPRMEAKSSVSKADLQSSIVSSNVISTTTMLSPFQQAHVQTIMGSPKYMVQEITSTVNDKRFLLTSLNTNTKERLHVMIKKLGGLYIDSPNFVENCTHIVLGKPNTGEKYLGGLVCGKWLLRIEYIEESYNQNYWLEESQFEWSIESISRNVPNTDKELAKLSSAARRCRLKYNAEGPFHGWTAIVLSNHPRRQECYERLFKAGGGRVINIADYKNRWSELNYILVDNPEQTHIPQDLKATTVPLLRINYLHNVVLEETLPDTADYTMKKEREQPANTLPHVPWVTTFIDVQKNINLISKRSPIDVTEFVRGSLENGHVRSILLPLAIQAQPDTELLKNVINSSLLPAESDWTMRQSLSELHILSWVIAPTHQNRQYYLNVLSKCPTDTFAQLLQDGIMDQKDREHKRSPEYLTWWIKLIEKDFSNWQQFAKVKPLAEQLFNVWHYPKRILRIFLKCYHAVMVSDTAQECMKIAMNSLLIVQFTSNEIKKMVFEANQKLNKAGTSTIDVIVEGVSCTLAAIIRSRDITRIHVLLSYVAYSRPLSRVVLDKSLINLSKALVPEHYQCLSNRSPSWEKFFNFYTHLRYSTSTTTSDAGTSSPDTSSPDTTELLNTEIYLILLSAMFRTLYLTSKPPSELDPLDKTEDLKYRLYDQTTRSSVLMINLLLKFVKCVGD